MNTYLIVLDGIGEHSIFTVSKEIFDWIVDPDLHGEPGQYNTWLDNQVPDSIMESIRKYATEDGVYLTMSSYNNDRALAAQDQAVMFYSTERHAVEDITKQGQVIADEYRGYLY